MKDASNKEKACCNNASPSPSSKEVHCAPSQRSGRSGIHRGVYFKPFALRFAVDFGKEAKISVSGVVNKALGLLLSSCVDKREGAPFLLEARRDQLLEEERSLRNRLSVILRSGAFLQDYAKRLLLGEAKEVARLKDRVGIYASIDEKELDVILRIIARREALVKELITLEDQLLPKDRYPFLLTDKGWKIGPSLAQKSRSCVTRKAEKEVKA